LPSPQLNDNELELLGKLNSIEANINDSNPITKTLIGDYSQRDPLPTPVRTPRYQDSLMREARNVLALQNVQTPLEGEANQKLEDPDFSGLTPKSKVPVTPNVLAQNINQQLNINLKVNFSKESK
jgi:pre-mRNA-splicing factor CDC5/CEF1